MAVSKRNRKKRLRRLQRVTRRPSRIGSLVSDGDEVVALLECEITPEPILDPRIEAMPPDDRESFRELERAVFDGHAGNVVEELEQFEDRYPQIPIIKNHLMIAYEEVGRSEEAEQLAQETFQRFPRYLFGLTNYVRFCLFNGRIDEAADILGDKLHICLMYPDRHRFHISEFTAYTAVVVEFLFLTGREDAARSHFRALKKVNPDHPMTLFLQHLLDYGSLVKVLRRFRQ